MNPAFRLPRSAIEKRVSRQFAQGFLPRGWIDGLIMSNDSTDATNDIVISPGVCRSTANFVDGAFSTLARDQMDMEIPVSIIKQLDVAWAPDNYDPDMSPPQSSGGRSGGRSSSSISNKTWHVFVIGSPSQQPDILLHDAVDPSAVLPSDYCAYRLIGSVIRVAGAILAFKQFGDEFMLATPTLDFNTALSLGVADTITLTVPAGVSVKALLNVYTQLSTSSSRVHFFHPSLTSAVASASDVPLASVQAFGSGLTQTGVGAQVEVRTDTAASIKAISNSAPTTRIATLGWMHSRGRDA